MMDPQAKEDFWEAVEDCLVEIHHLPRLEARKRRQELRQEIEHPPAPEMDSELFYHNEPFDVACGLAGNELDLVTYRATYELILERHHW